MSCTHSILTKFSPSAVPSSPQYPQVIIDTAQYSSLLLSIHPLSFLSTNCPLLAASFSFVFYSLSTLLLLLVSGTVMNQLDPIEELYDMYSEEEDTLRIVELGDDGLNLVSDIEGPANPYMDL